jgi:hypothetical protein
LLFRSSSTGSASGVNGQVVALDEEQAAARQLLRTRAQERRIREL